MIPIRYSLLLLCTFPLLLQISALTSTLRQNIRSKEALSISTTIFSTTTNSASTAASNPFSNLQSKCDNTNLIDKINVVNILDEEKEQKKTKKFFSQMGAGIARYQTLCVQIDVDLFELAAAVASGGASISTPTQKVLPFKITISFALNTQITYGSCGSDGKCPLSLAAEGSIGVGMTMKLGNLKEIHVTGFISGSLEISTEDANICDPSIHGGTSFISPISFKCGAGWLLGTWFTQFFEHRLSNDPSFRAATYHDLITDVIKLKVEQTVAEEQEAVAGLLTDMRLSRRLFKEEKDKLKQGSRTMLTSNDPLMLSKHPLYKKGAVLNYKHAHNSAPVFFAEAKLAQVDLQSTFEAKHLMEYTIANFENPQKCEGEAIKTAMCVTRAKLMDEAPFIQVSSKHLIKWREFIGLYPDPSLPAEILFKSSSKLKESENRDTYSTLEYTGSNVYKYILTGSDRLSHVYKKNKSYKDKKKKIPNAPTTVAYPFFKSKRSGCIWNNDNNDPNCYVRHPGLPLDANEDSGSDHGGTYRIAWSGANGIFQNSKSLLVLRRNFIWYIRWLLEIRILSSYFWPSDESYAGTLNINKPTTLDSCSSLPVSFEDSINHKNKNSAGMQLAREWGVVSCPNGAIDSSSGNNWRERRRKECVNDYIYVWNPRYFCHVGKILSNIPTDSDSCNDSKSRTCIKLNRPHFSRYEECDSSDSSGNAEDKNDNETCEKRRRPLSRYLFTQGQIKPIKAGTYDDPYYTSGHDELFPDEYAIPLWSANIFPYVTRAAVETMAKLRYCSTTTEGLIIINSFRSKLLGRVRSVDENDVDDDEDVEGDEDDKDDDKTAEVDDAAEAVERLNKGCEGEPLCVTWSFEQFWGVKGKSIADNLGYFNPKRNLTFGERAATIMPGLGYQMQNGYVLKIRGNLKAAGEKLAKQVKLLKLHSKLIYTAGLIFGISAGSSSIGFCTPDTNMFQINFPQLYWSGQFEPGKLDSRLKFTNPESWAADFYLFFPSVPVNLHVKRVGKIGAQPSKSYKYVLEIKVRIKNTWPTGSFNMNGLDDASWTTPTDVAGFSGLPSFIASALPTLAENLIPALIQIIYYTGDVLKNKKINAKEGLQLLQKALGSILQPHGALLAMGAGWFAPNGGPYMSASVNALILRATIEPGRPVTFGMTYAFTSIKELTIDVIPALTIKPAMLFGLKWDIGTWLNKNVLIKGIPKNILDTTSKDVDLFPDSSFRTDRCNTCVGVFDKVIQGGAYTTYCEKNTRSFELCGQVETAVKIFLESNGKPSFWRHWFGGTNRATKLSFDQMFGDNGTMKEVTKTFKDKCSKWPSELGQHDCLAQEFCLYSGVACHAKLKTELEEAKDVASILHLPKEGNSEKDFNPLSPGDMNDPIIDINNQNDDTTTIPTIFDILDGKDDVKKTWLKLPPSRATQLDPQRWSEWLRANKRGVKRRKKKTRVRGMIKNDT